MFEDWCPQISIKEIIGSILSLKCSISANSIAFLLPQSIGYLKGGILLCPVLLITKNVFSSLIITEKVLGNAMK